MREKRKSEKKRKRGREEKEKRKKEEKRANDEGAQYTGTKDRKKIFSQPLRGFIYLY